MKRVNIWLLLISLCLSMVLCSCQNTTVVTDDDSADDMELPEPKELKTVIYGETEESTIFHASESEYKEFDVLKYKETVSKNKINIDVLDVSYTGTYDTTAKLPCSDTKVYVYKLDGMENGEAIIINSETGKIVKYYGIPYSADLVSESDYIDFIKKVVGGTSDLSKYDYECTTHYYSAKPGEIRSQVVDGFKICGENESIGTYSFYYTKSIDGVELQDHISAEFFGGKFILEIYEYDYKNTEFSPVLDKMDEIEASVEKHLKDNVKDGCTIVAIEHGNKSLFIQDGIPYVMITSTVTYESQYSGGPVSIVIQTITG